MNRRALGLHWDVEPGLVFLNHGSFGLAPRELLQWRSGLLSEIERDPVAYLVDRLPHELAAARRCLAQFVGADERQLAFVPSTTYGLNELMQRLELLVDDLPAGSEILMLDHGYNATHNLVRFAAEQRGWLLRFVPLPLPLLAADQLVEVVSQAWTAATRVLLVDHITSPSALVMPLKELIRLARSREAVVIVDGAHGPGSLPLQLERLQPDAYVGNLHKWLCCPRGSAFLWVNPLWRDRLRPLVISHGANALISNDSSRFELEHNWIGTADPTPWLALPEVMRLLGSTPESLLAPLMQSNHRLAQIGQDLLLDALDGTRLAPPQCQGAMAAVMLPPVGLLNGALLQRCLLENGFQVPIIPRQPQVEGAEQFLRISCFAYNSMMDIVRLAEILPSLIASSLI